MGSKYGLVRWRVALAVMFVVPPAGCAWQPSGPGIAYTRGDKPPGLRKVSRPGEYALYPANSGEPLATFALADGDRYGFRRRTDNSPVGVVVSHGRQTEVELPGRLTTKYRWDLVAPAPPAGAVAAQP
jgi:hypothetical protein